jgi:hypothetical protein
MTEGGDGSGGSDSFDMRQWTKEEEYYTEDAKVGMIDELSHETRFSRGQLKLIQQVLTDLTVQRRLAQTYGYLG